jgi:hypothetical protein
MFTEWLSSNVLLQSVILLLHASLEVSVAQQFLHGVNTPQYRYRYRMEKNVKMDRRERRKSAMEQTHLAQGRDQWRALVMTVIKHHVP